MAIGISDARGRSKLFLNTGFLKSNFGSSKFKEASKISEAVSLIHRYWPHIDIDGPLQADFALNKEMLKKSFPFSKIAGKSVNTLIFPDLNSANIAYKLIKEMDGAKSIGPIMMGLRHPVHGEGQ